MLASSLGLALALAFTAEMDRLRDEGEAEAGKLGSWRLLVVHCRVGMMCMPEVPVLPPIWMVSVKREHRIIKR